MQYIELRLADVGERQARFQADRDAERSALGRDRSSLRRQLGESLVRLGRRVGGDAMTSPAWQGGPRRARVPGPGSSRPGVRTS